MADPERRSDSRTHWTRCAILLFFLCAGMLLSNPARAEDPEEFWPELNYFKRFNPWIRLYLVSAYAKGKESEEQSLDVAASLDITISQARNPSLEEQRVWKGKRYLWTRVGYDHVFKAEGKTKTTPEERLILMFYSRPQLPHGIFFEARARADFRWIGGDYSTRYRFRGELNRDFTVSRHVVTPYIQVEPFYDTRYNGWARTLYQVGAEIQTTEHFRLEPYVARQIDSLPESSALNAIGVVGKWYY